MSESQYPFYKELYLFSEIDCKDNHNKADFVYSGIDLFFDIELEKVTKEQWEMLSTIIDLCGFQLNNCLVFSFEQASAINQSLTDELVNYVFLFSEKSKLKQIQYRLQNDSFTTVNNKKLYVNSTLSQFADDKQAKTNFWKALQKEFKIK